MDGPRTCALRPAECILAPRHAQPDEEKHNLDQHEAFTIIKNPNFMGDAAEVSKKRRGSVAPGKKKSKEVK